MGVEAKLALQFTCFNPEILAELETQALFKDLSGKHASAFQLQTAIVVHQFGLSEISARKVVKHLRPDKNKPPLGDLPGYFAQLSYETGLGKSLLSGQLGRILHFTQSCDQLVFRVFVHHSQLINRPVSDPGFADNVFDRHWPPVSGITGIVPVIAHDKI